MSRAGQRMACPARWCATRVERCAVLNPAALRTQVLWLRGGNGHPGAGAAGPPRQQLVTLGGPRGGQAARLLGFLFKQRKKFKGHRPAPSGGGV